MIPSLFLGARETVYGLKRLSAPIMLCCALVAACSSSPEPSLQNTTGSRPLPDPRRALRVYELARIELRANDAEIKRQLAGRWIGRTYDPESLRAGHELQTLELRGDGSFAKTHRRDVGSCEIAGRWLIEHHTPDSVEIVLHNERHCEPNLAGYSYPLSILRLEDEILVLEVGPTGGLEGYRREH